MRLLEALNHMARSYRMGVLAMLVGAAIPVFAHHSFTAEFDATKPITLTGTVVKFDFINPHGWIYLDVKDDSGKVERWGVETGNPSMLLRAGWKKNSLNPGDQVTIGGFRAKDGSNTANGRTVTLADGTSLFAGSSAGPGAVPAAK